MKPTIWLRPSQPKQLNQPEHATKSHKFYAGKFCGDMPLMSISPNIHDHVVSSLRFKANFKVGLSKSSCMILSFAMVGK